MISSIDYEELSILKNHVTIEASNIPSYEATCSTILIQPNPIFLVLTQYATILKNNLIYHIYIINNLNYNIRNIKLKNILPKGIRFISTSIDNGEYKKFNNKIFYNIDVIEQHSFCKITVILCPITLGKKTNSIEVMCKKSNYICNNPCKISCMIGFKCIRHQKKLYIIDNICEI